jgi:hypothetical protein
MLRGAQCDRHDVISGMWSDVLAIMVEGALMCQELRATGRGTAVERTCKIYRKYVRRWLWKVGDTATTPTRNLEVSPLTAPRSEWRYFWHGKCLLDHDVSVCCLVELAWRRVGVHRSSARTAWES